MSFQANHRDLALPLGSLILVTGATGFIATHIVSEALKAGYSVRGTARTPAKAKDDETYHDSEDYRCIVVADATAPDAFDGAVKGCNGVIHVANSTDLQPDPHDVIPALVAGVTGLLEACAREPKITRFVYTSSSTAACMPIPGRKLHLDRTSWNDAAVVAAWEEPHTPEKAYTVYGASKTEAERAVFRFVRDRRPAFAVNSILPDTNFGPILNGRAGPTGQMIVDLYERGFVPTYCPSQYMVNVRDTARVHLTALVDASVNDERIFAWDSIFTWNKVIDVMSALRPREAGRLQSFKLENEISDVTTVDNALGAALLKKWYKQDGEDGRGWTGLTETLRENLIGLGESES